MPVMRVVGVRVVVRQLLVRMFVRVGKVPTRMGMGMVSAIPVRVLMRVSHALVRVRMRMIRHCRSSFERVDSTARAPGMEYPIWGPRPNPLFAASVSKRATMEGFRR